MKTITVKLNVSGCRKPQTETAVSVKLKWLAGLFPYCQTPRGHCEVRRMSMPLNFELDTKGVTRAVRSFGVKQCAGAGSCWASLPLTYTTCRPDAPVNTPLRPGIHYVEIRYRCVKRCFFPHVDTKSSYHTRNTHYYGIEGERTILT